MSSSPKLRNTNELIADRAYILTAFNEPISLLILYLLHKRGARSIQQIADELILPLVEVEQVLSTLKNSGLVVPSNQLFTLAPLAERRMIYDSISLDFLQGSTLTGDSETVPHPLSNTYAVRERIGKGATSFTFRAEQLNVHRDRTLKIFRPSTVTYDQLDTALCKCAAIQGDAALPEIIEVGQVGIQIPNMGLAVVPCIVLTYIDQGALPFTEFLKAQENFNSQIFERFVLRVGGALAAIEGAGLEHGDLHDGNILVAPGRSPSVAKDFWVIDFIGVPSASSPKLEVPSDIDNFRDHLLRAALVACERYPGYSARYLLGERVFRVLQGLRAGIYSTFTKMLADYHRIGTPISSDHFRSPAPQPFEWLRVEWIPSDDWLYKLFEPVPSRFETIDRFGNTWISGPRGCGKSHYLRVLAFHPKVISNAGEDPELAEILTQLNYDFKRAFGILFACRLGEFKGFTPEAIGQGQFDYATQAFLRHILVLKIWNKTLHAIVEGLELRNQSTGKPVLQAPHTFDEFIQFVEDRLGKMAVMDDTNPMDIFLQCLAMCTARENSGIAVWHDPARRPDIHLLSERDLDQFFSVVKRTFPDLSQTRFYVLVDDASFGHMHLETQKVMNSLIRAVQANHCFKVTCEKFMYTLDTSDGRPIDPRHEVTYVDLGEVSTKAQRETAIDLSKYMTKVVDRRLKAANFASGIKEILGDSQGAREFLSALSLPGARRPKKGEKPTKRHPRPKAYYAGWNIVWSLSHGSVRTLLELVEHIFKTNMASINTTRISLKEQDKAIRSYANRQFKALAMLPGEMNGEPLGGALQAVISAVGEMSRQYLEHYDTGEQDRWYETISVERLDRGALDVNALYILNELVKNGLLLDEGVTFSRAQFGLCERYDMNKIFAPAFETTYRVRNHIYLSRERFEELILHPDIFLARHRKKLKELAKQKKIFRQPSLFDNDDN